MGTIYVWMPEKGSYGHCSLLLDNGTYISWWPRDDKSKRKKKRKKVDIRGFLPDTNDDDVEQMGRRSATERFCIQSNKINVSLVDKWWKRYKLNGDGYHLITNNCCDVVLKALGVGGAFQWVHPGIKVISTPRYMSKYCSNLKGATKRSFVSRFKIVSFHPFW